MEKDEREDALAAGGVLVGGLLDGYEKAARARGVGATQIACLKTLGAFWRGYAPEDVGPEAVLDYRASRGVADGTLRRELNVLVAVFGWALKHGKVKTAPAIDLPPEGAPRAMFLDEKLEGDLWRLAAADVGQDGRLSRAGRFITIALATGARKASVEALTWDRVDLVRGVVDFRDPSVRVTKKRRVATPIPARLRPVLERANRERAPGSKFVLDHDGSVRTTFETFMETHGFDGVTPHTLKHTRITLLLRAGVSVWDVSALTGTSPDTIMSVYGHHAADDRLRAAADKQAAVA